MQTIKKYIKLFLFKAEEVRASLKFNITCPICQKSYSHFRTYNSRLNAMCFHCRSLERDRFLYLHLRKNTDLFQERNVKLLHFAPEISLYPLLKRSKNIEYYTADLMVTLNEYLQVKPDYIMSITDIKFDNNSFDYIICSHVLDDVDNDYQAMREMYRVLKPSGKAIISIPVDLSINVTIEFDNTVEKMELRKKMNVSYENRRFYGADFKDRMASVGFDVTLVKVTDLEKEESNKYALRSSDVLYICSKQ